MWIIDQIFEELIFRWIRNSEFIKKNKKLIAYISYAISFAFIIMGVSLAIIYFT